MDTEILKLQLTQLNKEPMFCEKPFDGDIIVFKIKSIGNSIFKKKLSNFQKLK